MPSYPLHLTSIPMVDYFDRLAKDAVYYEKEVKENEAKLQKMKDEGKDQYDIKMFREVLGESLMMVPDSKKRLNTSLEELSLLVDLHPDLEGEYMDKATELLKTVEQKDDVQETEVGDDEEVF